MEGNILVKLEKTNLPPTIQVQMTSHMASEHEVQKLVSLFATFRSTKG
tara:strand:+ start:13 stop:156 length:144 start_codon:yes stop_codon:yes gene_type:complete